MDAVKNLVESERSEEELQEPQVIPLTAQEAQLLSAQLVHVSPWRVLLWQLLAGCFLVGAMGIGGASQGALWSAAYGVVAVLVPGVVFARGMARQRNAKNAGAAMVGFFVWELVKLVLTIAILVAAPHVVVQLNWLVLLAGFVVTLKMHWLAVWLGSMRK